MTRKHRSSRHLWRFYLTPEEAQHLTWLERTLRSQQMRLKARIKEIEAAGRARMEAAEKRKAA